MTVPLDLSQLVALTVPQHCHKLYDSVLLLEPLATAATADLSYLSDISDI